MRRRRRLVTLAVVATVLASLSACTARPGAAAYVGGYRIPVSTVQSDSAEVIAAAAQVGQTGLDPSEVNRRQVNRLVTDRLIRIEAARRGITVSDAEVDTLLAQAAGDSSPATFANQLAASQLVPPSGLTEFAQTVALNQKLLAEIAPNASQTVQTDELVKLLGALSTQLGTGVSPRYGVWDPGSLSVDLPPDDLSTPAPASGSGSGTTTTP